MVLIKGGHDGRTGSRNSESQKGVFEGVLPRRITFQELLQPGLVEETLDLLMRRGSWHIPSANSEINSVPNCAFFMENSSQDVSPKKYKIKFVLMT